MATMKLLLKESIKNVGRVGDVVEVSPGYARNYLLPNDLAVQPTPGNIKQAGIRAIEAGFTKYTAIGGIKELRKAIVDKHARGVVFGSSRVIRHPKITEVSMTDDK